MMKIEDNTLQLSVVQKKNQPRLQAFKNKFKVLINLIKIFTNCGTHDIPSFFILKI